MSRRVNFRTSRVINAIIVLDSKPYINTKSKLFNPN
jgi:hypothetical protein